MRYVNKKVRRFKGYKTHWNPLVNFWRWMMDTREEIWEEVEISQPVYEAPPVSTIDPFTFPQMKSGRKEQECKQTEKKKTYSPPQESKRREDSSSYVYSDPGHSLSSDWTAPAPSSDSHSFGGFGGGSGGGSGASGSWGDSHSSGHSSYDSSSHSSSYDSGSSYSDSSSSSCDSGGGGGCD